MTNEIDTILDAALAEVGREFIDGDIVETPEAFERFMVHLVHAVFPNHEISTPEPGKLFVRSTWSFTLDVTDIFKQMKPFSPGENRDIIHSLLHRQLVRRNVFHELEKKNPAQQFDERKLILVPRMGSAIRSGPKGSNLSDATEAEKEMLSRPVYGYVHAVPVINEPTHLIYVPRLALPMVGLSEDEVFARAMHNLKSKAEQVVVEFEDDVAFIGNEAMAGMASQLIFYPDFWKSLSAKVGDYLFIHVVEDNEIIVCKSSARETILSLITGVAIGKIGALLPATFFTYDDNGFRLFARTLPDNA